MSALPLAYDDAGTALAWEPGQGYRPATAEEVAAEEVRLASPPPPPSPRRAPSRSMQAAPATPARNWDAPPATDVPRGRYAVEIDGVLRFFSVSDTGRVWQQHSDDFVAISTERQERAAQAINADRRAALVRYGREIGKCGVCTKTLTNPVSLAEGIGPVCGGRLDPDVATTSDH